MEAYQKTGGLISVRLEPVPVPESEPRDPPPQGECLYPWSLAPREAISLLHTCYTGPHVTLLLLSALCPQDPALPLLWLIVTIRTMKTLTKTTGLGQLPLSRQTSQGPLSRLGYSHDLVKLSLGRLKLRRTHPHWMAPHASTHLLRPCPSTPT